jgi:hypothetical protein
VVTAALNVQLMKPAMEWFNTFVLANTAIIVPVILMQFVVLILVIPKENVTVSVFTHISVLMVSNALILMVTTNVVMELFVFNKLFLLTFELFERPHNIWSNRNENVLRDNFSFIRGFDGINWVFINRQILLREQ